MNKLIFGLVSAMVVSLSVQAAEMDHTEMDHAQMGHQPMDKMRHSGSTDLKTLSSMPSSGVAREGGYDGRYIMESTGIGSAQNVRCAQASRGLIMMDNAEWSLCGGKPAGAAEASLPMATGTQQENGHAGHKM